MKELIFGVVIPKTGVGHTVRPLSGHCGHCPAVVAGHTGHKFPKLLEFGRNLVGFSMV
jgi:hypothetical protein